jgi:hypothetical protein
MQVMFNSAFESKYLFAFRGSFVVGFTLSDALTIEISCLWMRKNCFPFR